MMSNKEPGESEFPRFDLSDYSANPKTVKKTYDALHRYAGTLYAAKEQLRMENKALERENSLLKTDNAILKDTVHKSGVTSAYQAFLGAFGGILASFGIAIVYASQDHSNPLGWFLIFAGFVLVVAAFIFHKLATKQPEGDSE